MHPGDLARTINVLESCAGEYKNSAAANNPSSAAVIADTGALTEGWYDVYYFVSASVALAFDDLSFQWRNAANGATKWEDYFQSAGADRQKGKIKSVYVATDERFRIITANGITGDVTGSIIAIKRVGVITYTY